MSITVFFNFDRLLIDISRFFYRFDSSDDENENEFNSSGTVKNRSSTTSSSMKMMVDDDCSGVTSLDNISKKLFLTDDSE